MVLDRLAGKVEAGGDSGVAAAAPRSRRPRRSRRPEPEPEPEPPEDSPEPEPTSRRRRRSRWRPFRRPCPRSCRSAWSRFRRWRRRRSRSRSSGRPTVVADESPPPPPQAARSAAQSAAVSKTESFRAPPMAAGDFSDCGDIPIPLSNPSSWIVFRSRPKWEGRPPGRPSLPLIRPEARGSGELRGAQPVGVQGRVTAPFALVPSVNTASP